MRLIDADKLIEDIEKLNLELFEEFKYADSEGMKISSNAQMYIICESVLPIIKEQPTAFDVEKVVEQLEEQISKHDLLFNKYVKDKDKSCSWSISELNKIRGLLEAIDVVKAGGIDEK